MTRREFLLSTAASAGARSFARATGASSTAPSRELVPAIDTHIHLFDPTRPLGVPWPAKTDPLLYRPHLPETFRTASSPFRVIGAVVVEASDWVEDNQWILDLAQANDAIVGFIGNLKLGAPDFAPNLKRFAANPLFRGLRLRMGDVQSPEPAARAASLRLLADHGLTVDLLDGSSLLAPAARLASDYSSLRFVIDHLPFKEWDGQPELMRGALAPIANHPNVFVKISDVVRTVDRTVVTDAAHYRPGLDVLRELFGPERLLYASNWPVSDRVAPYAMVHRVVADYFASRPRAEAEQFFWRNSLAAYRWLRRGATAALMP